MNLGEKITLLRKEKGWTQEDLAKLTGLSRMHISAIENGRRDPGLKTITIIAQYLEVKLEELIEGDGGQ